MASNLKGEKKMRGPKKPMYYKNEDDLNLIRDSDMGGEDSSDPFDTDGYGPEDDRGMAGDEDGTDPWSLPGEGKMPPSDGSTAMKLRKRGAPMRGRGGK